MAKRECAKRLAAASLALMLLTGCGANAPDASEPEPEEPPKTQASGPEEKPASEPIPAPVEPEPEEPLVPIPAPVMVPERPTRPFAGKLIVVDPGHCRSPLYGKGYTERVSPLNNERKALYTRGTSGRVYAELELNLIVGLKLRDALEELGAEVLMTREVNEITVGGIERCDLGNDTNADVAIRIHADGNDNPEVNGVAVLIPTGNLLGTPEIEAPSAELGQYMVNAVAAATGAKNRGTKGRRDLTGFNFSEIPSILIEMGFMSNPAEDAKLSTDEYQNKIVDGMVTSLFLWYGIDPPEGSVYAELAAAITG